MTAAAAAADVAIAYHERTKHSLKRYAAGPETLDWDLQPDPFRAFAGAPRVGLPFPALALETSFAAFAAPGTVAPARLDLDGVAILLELSMGLSAWKELGPDRWAVRCNPSSGNLHPTEAYVLAEGVPGLDGGLYHYVSRDHVLERRCRMQGGGAAPRLWVALSSIGWREAWKYGERAFRYCQLDTGHAFAAVGYAAAALGWRARLVADMDTARLAALTGLDRAADFAGAEAEEPELLIAIEAGAATDAALPVLDPDGWAGRANLLDRHPMYRWPVIAEVAEATRDTLRPACAPEAAFSAPPLPARVPPGEARAVDVILGRRSAQRFDARFHMGASTFFHLLDSLLPRPEPPFEAWPFAPALHPVLFVHRVEGVEPGLYALPRRADVEGRLRGALRPDFGWEPVEGAPAHLPLRRLARTDCRGVARTVSCHQAIAGDSCFSLGLLAAFAAEMAGGAHRYRALFREAGLLGQILYLEAEAAGLRGTGIGCYFDDDLHRLLGLEGRAFQSLYHFTVGRALTDPRIASQPAYAGRPA